MATSLKNLLVNGKNKITARTNALSKIQTDMANRTTATNVNSTPNLPTTVTRPTTVNLKKAQQPVQTKLNNLNTSTGITSNNPAFNNGQLITQNNQPSRFIGFQHPKTDLGGNLTQEGIKSLQPKGQSFNDVLKPALYIPTETKNVAKETAKNSKEYKANENLIKRFHYAVKNANGQLTKEQIRKDFPEWKDKLDAALQLQADIAPLATNGQFADMNQISDFYNELLPKQKEADTTKLKEQEEMNKNLSNLSAKADKLLSRYNTLSNNGVKVLEDYKQLSQYVDNIKKNYRLVGDNITDYDIINYVKDNIPEVRQLVDEIQQLEMNFNLTDEDRNVLYENGFDIGDWLLQAGADIQNFTQNNQLANYLSNNSAKRSSQLKDLGFNASSANTLGNLPSKALSIGSIPVNMVGELAGGVGQVDTALERIAKQQNRNEDGTIDTNGVIKDVVMGGGGAMTVGWNTVMAIPTAIYNLANETEVGAALTDTTIGNADRGLDKLLSGEKLKGIGLDDNAIAEWYNNQDEQTQAEARKILLTAIFHKGSKGIGKLKKLGNFEMNAVSEALNDLSKQKVSIETNSPTFKAKVEQGLADGLMKISDDGILTDKNGNNIGKVKVKKMTTGEKTRYVVDRIISINRAAWNARSLGELNPNALPDNRTIKEKAQSQINQAKENITEGIEGVKEGVNNIVDTTKQGINKAKNVANRIEIAPGKVGEVFDSMKNKVTSKKPTSQKSEMQEQQQGLKEQSLEQEQAGQNNGEIKITNDTQKIGKSKTGGTLSEKVYDKLTGLDEATRERMKANPYSAEENKNLIDTMESDTAFDFNEYQTNRYQNVLDTIVDKLEQKENTRKNEVGPLYQKLEETNAPIDTTNIKRQSTTFRDKVAENDGIISSSEQTKINKLLDAIDSLGDGTTDIWKIRRMADQWAKWDTESTTDGIRLIREIRDAIDDEIRVQRPEMKEVDTEYRRIKDEIADLRGNLINKKSGKLRDNAVSTVKNLLNPTNKQFLDRLEKEIPGITKQLQAIRDSKFVYNAYQTGNGSRFISGIARGTLGNMFKAVGVVTGGIPGLLFGALLDKAVDTALVSLTRKALKATITEMTPKAQAELESIMKKVQEGKELTAKEKAKLKEIENKIVENAENAKKTKAEQEAWNSFLNKVKKDAKSLKLPDKGGTDGGKNILTNGKTIITDAQGNSKVKGQISEIDKRPSKPEDTTPPSNPTTPTKPTEPKNKITNKTPKKDNKGSTKIVDKNGNPKNVYHYSDTNFRDFDLSKQKNKLGIYFSPSSKPNSKLRKYRITATIDMQNPLTISPSNKSSQIYPELKQYTSDEYDGIYDTKFRELLIRDGYDGVIMLDDKGNVSQYVVLNPEQVNVKNQGPIKTAETPKSQPTETKTKITETSKNKITNKPVDNSSITGKFRNLTREEYQTMKDFEGLEEMYLKGDKDTIHTMLDLKDSMGLIDPVEYGLPEDIEFDFHNWKVRENARDVAEIQQLFEELRDGGDGKKFEKDWGEYMTEKKDGTWEWNYKELEELQKDLVYEMLKETLGDEYDTWSLSDYVEDLMEQFGFEREPQIKKGYLFGELEKKIDKRMNQIGALINKYGRYWEQGQMVSPETKRIRSWEDFRKNIEENETPQIAEEDTRVRDRINELENNETAQDINYQELAEAENETAQIPNIFEEDLQEMNLRDLELFDNETPQITEEEAPTNKPKNVITKEKGNYKEMSPEAIKNTFKKGTEMTVKIGDSITSYQIEADEGDNVVVLMLHKRTPLRRIRVAKDTLVNNIVSKADSAVYDNTMKHDIIKSDLPISDLVEQEKINKQRQEDFNKLGLKSGDYIKYSNGDVYKITDVKDGKVYYEDAKTGANERTYIENIPGDFSYGIANKGSESDFNEAREKVQAKARQAKEEEEARIQKEKERLEPIQSYLDTIKNASQKTKAQNHLLSSHTWKDLNGKQLFGNRAKMLRSLIDEGYTLNTEETGKFYPNGSPKVEYQLVEPGDKPFRKYFSISKVDYDYVAHQLEQKGIKYDDEEISKEDEEKLEKELFNKKSDNSDYESRIIKDNSNYKFEDLKDADIETILSKDGFEKYTFEEDGQKGEGYAGYINGKAVDIIPNKEKNRITINVGDELFRSYDDGSINVQLNGSDEITQTSSVYNNEVFKGVLARALGAEYKALGEPKSYKYDKDNGVFAIYDKSDSDKIVYEVSLGDKVMFDDGTIYDTAKHLGAGRTQGGEKHFDNKPVTEIFAGKTLIGISKGNKYASNKYTDTRAQGAVLKDMESIQELEWLLEDKNNILVGEIEGTPVKVSALDLNYNPIKMENVGKEDDYYNKVKTYKLQVGKNTDNTYFYDTFPELKSALKRIYVGEDVNKTTTEVTGEKNAVTAKQVENEKPKNLVTSRIENTKQEIQEIDKDTYFDDIVKNLKDHPREMFIYKDGNYFYPHYILPSGKVITPENTYWGEVSSEEAARNWLLKEAEEHSEENETKKAEKLKEIVGKTAEKYEATLKRIESDNPMQEIWTSGDYFKYGVGNNQMARAKKESEANAEVGTFKKDVIDGKEGYRIFVAGTKNEAIRAFYDPKTGKTYRIYRGPIIDDSKPYTTKQVERIEKFLQNVDKQLDKETKKEKKEEKQVITQEWLDSLKPDKDGIIELDYKGDERWALGKGKEALIKEGKADGKYLYNYGGAAHPQYMALYIKNGIVYEGRKGLEDQYMTTKQEAIDWLNQKEKDVEHESTERYTQTDYETLPKTISVESEAEKAGPKRIAPDRVKRQQETYDQGLESVKNVLKQSPVKIYELGFKSDRSKAVQNILEERKRIRQLPETEAEKQWNELAKSVYEDLVIKDISKGYRYPEDVTNRFPKDQMKKAVDARARYEKGLFTSFSAKDTRANNQYRDEIGAGIKSQDGKPVTQEQMNEIVDGIRAYSNIFGVDMKKFAEDNNVIYVHLHGGNPFLMGGMSIAGLYRRDAAGNISVSLGGREGVMEKGEDGKMKKSDIKTTTVHEITHAVDGMLEGKLFSDADTEILKKTMNKPSELINYYNRKQEIVARAVEQYAAHQLGKKLYRTALANIDWENGSVEFVEKEANYVDREAYWNQENFDKYVKPIVEKNMKEKMKDYMIQQPKNNVLGNDKNKVTTQAARASRPSIRMNVEEREKKNPTANPMNKVTSRTNTNQNDISDLDPDLASKVGLKYKIKDANDEVLHGLIDYVLKKKGVKPVKNGLRGKIYSMNQALPKLKKGDDLSKKNAVDRLGYKVKDMALYRMAKKNNEYILDEKKKNDNNTHINFKVGKKSILLHMSNELYNILKGEGYIVSPGKYFYLKRKKKLKRGS